MSNEIDCLTPPKEPNTLIVFNAHPWTELPQSPAWQLGLPARLGGEVLAELVKEDHAWTQFTDPLQKLGLLLGYAINLSKRKSLIKRLRTTVLPLHVTIWGGPFNGFYQMGCLGCYTLPLGGRGSRNRLMHKGGQTRRTP